MSDPVTIVVRRKVRPGREKDYEAWLERLTREAAERFPGYLGAEFHRPASADGEYRSVFRFDSLEHLDAFERMTGLEFRFDPPPGTVVPQPIPHRMALVLVTVVFCLVLILNLTPGPLMTGWPLVLRVLVAVTI